MKNSAAGNVSGDGPKAHPQRCLVATHKVGRSVQAKKAAKAYASDFYAGPWCRRQPTEAHSTRWKSRSTAMWDPYPAEEQLFTLPQRRVKGRRVETQPRLPRLWLCTKHQHRQCATCATVGRGVRHCCAKGYT